MPLSCYGQAWSVWQEFRNSKCSLKIKLSSTTKASERNTIIFPPLLFEKALAELTWGSKVICVSFGFALLRSVIGLKISCHFLDQSEVKPKPIVTCSRKFSCASCNCFVQVLIGQWIVPCPLWLARVITLGLVLQHSVENSSVMHYLCQ